MPAAKTYSIQSVFCIRCCTACAAAQAVYYYVLLGAMYKYKYSLFRTLNQTTLWILNCVSGQNNISIWITYEIILQEIKLLTYDYQALQVFQFYVF